MCKNILSKAKEVYEMWIQSMVQYLESMKHQNEDNIPDFTDVEQ